MIGDIILYLRTLFKQTFCIHDYKYKSMEIGIQMFTSRKCTKCKREKWRS